MKICVSIASYRDPDLLNTVESCYENAKNKQDISFCIVSQAEDDEHPSLAHIPNVYYYKYHWSESRGVCWARNIAVGMADAEYILQIDSHSRFKKNWDETLYNLYRNAIVFWGHRIILTQYADIFEWKDGKEEYSIYGDDNQQKAYVYWNEDNGTLGIGKEWQMVEDNVYGDEVFYVTGGCTFTHSAIFKSVIADPEIYFQGEELSIALRAYTRGIRMINPGKSFLYSNYVRESNDRRLHWEDNENWQELENKSRDKIRKLFSGNLQGDWGIHSYELYKQYMKLNNLDFLINNESIFFSGEADE